MDEPTHQHESEFWDQVVEWLLAMPHSSQAQQSVRSTQALPPNTQDGREPR